MLRGFGRIIWNGPIVYHQQGQDQTANGRDKWYSTIQTWIEWRDLDEGCPVCPDTCYKLRTICNTQSKNSASVCWRDRNGHRPSKVDPSRDQFINLLTPLASISHITTSEVVAAAVETRSGFLLRDYNRDNNEIHPIGRGSPATCLTHFWTMTGWRQLRLTTGNKSWRVFLREMRLFFRHRKVRCKFFNCL